MSQDPTPREMGYYFAIAGVGLEMVLPAVVGMYIDEWLHTIPWTTIALGIFGFAGGLFHLVAILNRKEREGEDAEDKKPPP